MSRDRYEGWDDQRDAGPDSYDSRGGGRRRRGARADEQWRPDPEASDSYPGQGSQRRSGQHSGPGAQGAGYGDYADQGYSDPGYGDRGYGDGGRGYAGSAYPDDQYGGSGYPGAGYGEPGYAEPGGYGQPGGYGSAGYGGANDYTDGGYAGPDFRGSGQHGVPGYGDTGNQNGYPDAGYPAGGYGDGGYGATDQYRAEPNGYDGATFGGGGRSSGGYSIPDPYSARAGYGEQDSYGGRAGYDTGDPYAGRDSRGQPGVNQAGHDRPAGAQFGGGYDEHDYGAAGASGPRQQYPDPAAEYVRADRGGRYGWQDPVDDTGVTRRRRDPDDDFDPDSARHNGFFRGFGAQDDAVGHRPPKRRRSRAGMVALLILVLFVAGVVGGGAYAYKWYSKRHADWVGSKGYGSVIVTVAPGAVACSGTMENMLVNDGVVESASAFCSAAKNAANANALEPGTFRLHKHMGAALAWAMITNPKSRVQIVVAIPDGMRASKIIALMAQKTGKPLSEFESALKDPALGLPSWAKGNPEGFLWPATYNFQPGTSALAMLQTLVKQANTEFASINLPAKAKAAQFTEYQVIIEASLLEAEVGPQYYTKVARVIDNRLNQGMTLGLDSTVAYVLNKYIYNLTQSDLNVNSPYNTTKHTDLPPGPIDSPDLAAIQAVLHPASGTYLYFVTVNKQGLTEFTSDPNQFQIWSNEAKRNGV